jgi:hypothetical protein
VCFEIIYSRTVDTINGWFVMSAKENRELVHRWVEEFNKGKAAAMAVI